MLANYQATTYNPYVSHITDEAIRRTREHESRGRVLEAYSHLQNTEGILGGPDGNQKVSFNLHIIG